MGDGPDDSFSDHPTDRMIRELLRTYRESTWEEIGRILDRIASAPFIREVRVPSRDRGLSYLGRTVGARADSRFYHLAKRVAEGQWANGTTEEEYSGDLKDAARNPAARPVLYRYRGGNLAAVLAPNEIPERRRGSGSLGYVFVVYSADRARIVSGYQVSGVGEVKISGNPLWLK